MHPPFSSATHTRTAALTTSTAHTHMHLPMRAHVQTEQATTATMVRADLAVDHTMVATVREAAAVVQMAVVSMEAVLMEVVQTAVVLMAVA